MTVERTPMEWVMLPLKKYAQFSGRAPRAEYWWFYLATLVVGFVADLIDRVAGSEIGVLGLVLNLALIVPTIAVTVRRLHDTDRTGWWVFAIFIPLVGLGFMAGAGIIDSSFDTFTPSMAVGLFAVVVAAIVLFIFLILPGTDGPNQYGADPYGPDQLEEIFA